MPLANDVLHLKAREESAYALTVDKKPDGTVPNAVKHCFIPPVRKGVYGWRKQRRRHTRFP
jgi:hypothetical protein